MNNEKTTFFIINIDTEGDNEWTFQAKTSTKNARFIPRFQELCEKYLFKPTYLLTYEMATDFYLINYLRPKVRNSLCEIGAHLHPWTNPPFDFTLPEERKVKPYIFEYPFQVQKEKIRLLKNSIISNFHITPLSYKAARWGIDRSHFSILAEEGFLVDTSYCPGINWKNSLGFKKGGNDYSNSSILPFYINMDPLNSILEIPQTIIPLDLFRKSEKLARFQLHNPYINKFIKLFNGKFVWLRPFPNISLEILISIVRTIIDYNINILQITFHSSELMPSGSPYNKTEESIEELYNKLDSLFMFLAENEVQSATLNQYYNYIKSL